MSVTFVQVEEESPSNWMVDIWLNRECPPDEEAVDGWFHMSGTKQDVESHIRQLYPQCVITEFETCPECIDGIDGEGDSCSNCYDGYVSHEWKEVIK